MIPSLPARNDLGMVAGWISSTLAYHQRMESHCEHRVRNGKKKNKKISIYKLAEKFSMRICYISAQSLLHYAMAFYVCFFFSFINSDVDHYHILLSVVITADKRDEPETSMHASNTWLYGAPNQFSVLWAYLEQNKRNLWQTKCSREWDAGWWALQMRSLVEFGEDVTG